MPPADLRQRDGGNGSPSAGAKRDADANLPYALHDRMSAQRLRAIRVPIEMRDSVPLRSDDEFMGRVTYSRFRRFQVQVQEAIDVPAQP